MALIVCVNDDSTVQGVWDYLSKDDVCDEPPKGEVVCDGLNNAKAVCEGPNKAKVVCEGPFKLWLSVTILLKLMWSALVPLHPMLFTRIILKLSLKHLQSKSQKHLKA